MSILGLRKCKETSPAMNFPSTQTQMINHIFASFLACVASVSVRFGSKELQGAPFFLLAKRRKPRSSLIAAQKRLLRRLHLSRRSNIRSFIYINKSLHLYSQVCTHDRGQDSPIQTDLVQLIRC